MTGVMGGFFLGLVWDRLTGQADTPGRVQFRAAQLRYTQMSKTCDHEVSILVQGMLSMESMSWSAKSCMLERMPCCLSEALAGKTD